MNASVFSLWRVRVLALALAIVGAGALSLMMVSTVSAAAPTGFTSQTYSDNDGNGAIDRATVVINGGEALTSCVVTDAEVATDWTYTGGLTFAGSLTTTGNQHSCVTGTATITFIVQSSTAGITGGGTAPTISHDNDDADNSIANASGNLGVVAPTSLTDAAKPAVLTAVINRTALSGITYNTLLLTYSEDLRVSTDAGSDADIAEDATAASTTTLGAMTSARTLAGIGTWNGTGDQTNNAATNNTVSHTDKTITVYFNAQTGSYFSATGTGVSTDTFTPVSDATDVADTLGNAVNASGTVTFTVTSAWDATVPTVSNTYSCDSDNDGDVEIIQATFSESVRDADSAFGQFEGDNDSSGTGTTATAMSSTTSCLSADTDANDDKLEFTISTGVTGTESAYLNAAVGTRDHAGNRLAAGNGLGTENDRARPVLMTTSPADEGTAVLRNATITLTFSEIINSLTWTLTGDSTTMFTQSLAAAAVTQVPNGLMSGAYHSLTISAAPDAATNTFYGVSTTAAATVTNPFNFTMAANSSTASAVSSTTSYDIDVTAPNGGEEYNAGDVVDITWSSESGSAMSAVNINLMYVIDDVTYQETIVSATANDGSYSWTVPDIDSGDVKIQIVGTDLVTTLATDESDAAFTVGTVTTSDDDGEAEDTSEEDTSEDVTVPSTGTTGLSPVTGEMEEISEVSAGQYVRSSYFSTVYYIDEDTDGNLIRRPFLDAQTFMTWQDDWSDVETVTDATLPTISLGSQMLPKAGVVLVKIQSDARVFAVEGDNTIRWISSEEVAIAIYGANWADYVIDVSATTFPRFTEGDDVDGVENTETDDMKTREAVNS